jgi:hypothetical protein
LWATVAGGLDILRVHALWNAQVILKTQIESDVTEVASSKCVKGGGVIAEVDHVAIDTGERPTLELGCLLPIDISHQPRKPNKTSP